VLGVPQTSREPVVADVQQRTQALVPTQDAERGHVGHAAVDPGLHRTLRHHVVVGVQPAEAAVRVDGVTGEGDQGCGVGVQTSSLGLTRANGMRHEAPISREDGGQT